MSTFRIIRLAGALVFAATVAAAQTSASKTEPSLGLEAGLMPPVMDQGI